MTVAKFSNYPEDVYCPICGMLMLPTRIEYPDGSGWFYGWSCDCTETLRNDYPGQEVVIHSITDENGCKVLDLVPFGAETA